MEAYNGTDQCIKYLGMLQQMNWRLHGSVTEWTTRLGAYLVAPLLPVCNARWHTTNGKT